MKLKNEDTITFAAIMQKHDKIWINCFIWYSLIDFNDITQQYIEKIHIFFEHSFQNKIHFTAMIQHCSKVENQMIWYKYQVIWMKQNAFSKDNDFVLSRIEFVDINAIDCLVDLMKVHSDQTVKWWVVNWTHEKKKHMIWLLKILMMK